MNTHRPSHPPLDDDEPLPLTLLFVMIVGVFILVGWFAMFALLSARW